MNSPENGGEPATPAVCSEDAGQEAPAPAPSAPAPAVPAGPSRVESGPSRVEQSAEDTDAGWGEYPESARDRLYRDRPPHWADH